MGNLAPLPPLNQPLGWSARPVRATHVAGLQGLHGKTPVQTPTGLRRISDLIAGDVIMTEAAGPQTIHSITQTHYSYAQLMADYALAPIRFDADALAPDADDDIAILMAPDTALTPHAHMSDRPLRAADVANGGDIRPVVPDEGITYYDITLHTPAAICVAGLVVQLGPVAETGPAKPAAVLSLREDRRVFRPMT